MNGDILTLAIMLTAGASCGAMVLLGEQLHRLLTQEPEGDGSDSDSVVGDWPHVSDDLKVSRFHNEGNR